MSADQYDEVTRRLEEAGQSAPVGRRYHVAFAGAGGLNVFDVWDSQESFDAFGQTLMPILAEAGVDTRQPSARFFGADVRSVRALRAVACLLGSRSALVRAPCTWRQR